MKYCYDGSRRFNIKSFDCADKGEFKERHEAIAEFTHNLEKINEYQQKLFAEQKEGIIFVFQAMDAAGKDGAVRAVLSCLSPQGVSESSFKTPSAEEGRHDYLWRIVKALPEKGQIAIFNRSHYEDVLVQKVHSYYANYKWADRIEQDKLIDQRYGQIRDFEKYLWENSFRVVKIFLNVSKEEQARRFISRIDTPKKNWKFSSSDVKEREFWDDYMDAYETAINRTARPCAPWYVVPADHKWYARLVISRIVLEELEKIDPQWPEIDEEERQTFDQLRARLALECELVEEEKEDKKYKIRPADTAISLALKSDISASKRKKLEKKLKRHVAETFTEEFGVSEETRDAIGELYLQFEEQETTAEAEVAKELGSEYEMMKDDLRALVAGRGKEGKKLYSRFKKDVKARIALHDDAVNALYLRYAENVRQFVTDFDQDLAEGMDPAAALEGFRAAISCEYETHRTDATELAEETGEALSSLYGKYVLIAGSFEPEEEEAEMDWELVDFEDEDPDTTEETLFDAFADEADEADEPDEAGGADEAEASEVEE